MFSMFNPMSAMTSQLPSVGNDADEGDKERDEEEEKLRREAIKEAEEKRRVKHKKMEEERESLRQGIRDKYKIEKPDDSEEEEDEEDFGAPSVKEDLEDDSITQKARDIKDMAEKGVNAAKDKCKVQ